MAAGYFADAITNVGLDEEPSALVSGQGFGPIVLQPWNQTQATLFQRGGGYMQIRVKWTINRHNRGDAEWYVYQKCKNLALIGTGELYVQGNVYEHAVCLSCTASIEEPAHDGNLSSWSCKVLMNVVFEVSIPETTSNLSPTYSAPATPGEYTSRTSDGAFTFKGTSIADSPLRLTPSLRCQHVRHLLPRAYGVFHEDQTSGAVIRLQLEGTHWKSTRALLEDEWRDILVTIRDDVGSLVGNGNTYADCYMADAPSMDDSDRRFSAFGIGFSHAPVYVYAEYAFKTIQVSGQSNVVADTNEDTLTFVGVGITITIHADTITFQVGSINVLSDVAITSVAKNHVLYSNDGSGFINATANTAGLLAKTGAQTVVGVKTFGSIPVLPGGNPTSANEMARKGWVDAQATTHGTPGNIILCPMSYHAQTVGTWVITLNSLLDFYCAILNDSVSDGDQLDFLLPLAAGTYTIVAVCWKMPMSGILSIDIDAVEVGNIDLYDVSGVWNHRYVETGIVLSTGGLKTLSLRADGKNANSMNYALRVQRVYIFRES